jgi:hypothetical protein
MPVASDSVISNNGRKRMLKHYLSWPSQEQLCGLWRDLWILEQKDCLRAKAVIGEVILLAVKWR